MKVTIFSILMVLFFSGMDYAQTPDVEWIAKNTRPEGDTYIEKLISLDNNGYIALRGKETMTAQSYVKLFLQHYDLSFKPGEAKFIPYRLSNDICIDNGKTPSIIYFDKFDEDVFLITTDYDKNNSTLNLLAKRIDPETLEIDEQGVKLAELSFPEKHSRTPYKYIFISKSADGKNMVALIDLPGEKDDQKKYLIYVFNNKLQLIWTREVTVSYPNENMYVNSCFVDNNGNVSISANIITYSKSQSARVKATREFLLFYLKSDNSNMVETKLTIAGINLAGMGQSFDKTGNVVCGGFYTMPSSSVYKGVFILQTDPAKGTIINSSYKAFSPEYLRTMLSEEVKKFNLVDPNALDDYGYTVTDVLILENGTIKLIAEQQIYVLRKANNSFDTYKHRSFDNILCVSADNTAKIQWMARIPKLQDEYPSNCFYFNSFHVQVLNNTLQFLYNDNPENYKSDKQESLSYNTKFVTYVTNIDENGKLSTNELWDPLTEKVMLIPKAHCLINNRQTVFETKKGKNEFFVKLEFK